MRISNVQGFSETVTTAAAATLPTRLPLEGMPSVGELFANTAGCCKETGQLFPWFALFTRD